MKSILCMAGAVLGLVSSPAAHAADFWSTPTLISQIYPHDAGLAFYVDYTNSLSTCGGNRWVIQLSGPNYKVLAGALLVAYTQGQKIQIHVNDQPASCEPVVDRFIVTK